MSYLKKSVNKFNPSDMENSYMLGRKVFNSCANLDDNQNCNNNKCKNGIPVKELSSSTRTQRLRLITIGSASITRDNNQKSKLNSTNKNVQINNNDAYRALSRARSSGYIAPYRDRYTRGF